MFLIGCIIYFFAIAGAIVAIERLITKERRVNWGEAKFVSFIIVLIWFRIAFNIFASPGTVYKKIIYEYDISAIRDSSSTIGLGSFVYASAGPGLSIYYMQKNEYGSTTPRYLSSSNDVRIYEGNYDPKILKVRLACERENNILRRMFIGPCLCYIDPFNVSYEIYVPTGTVVSDFELDLR